MWEFSVSVGARNIDVAKFIYQTLKSNALKFDAVVTCYEEYENFYILFACPEEYKNEAVCVVENCIIKTISNFYKERFLDEHLRLPLHEKIGLMAFKKALINFDKETDIFLISKYLIVDKNLHLFLPKNMEVERD